MHSACLTANELVNERMSEMPSSNDWGEATMVIKQPWTLYFLIGKRSEPVRDPPTSMGVLGRPTARSLPSQSLE